MPLPVTQQVEYHSLVRVTLQTLDPTIKIKAVTKATKSTNTYMHCLYC